ncbi:membrane-associated oxidoreductase [Streptomyces sp. NPDC052101]|uniref:membrane-associated oxidoreductase n=1 Tax=Streptomyces sp. NPDC052101 TaxID=3155763 RepID=UPI003432E097
MDLDELTPAERRVWQAFPRGERVDFGTAADEDVAEGGSWGPERTVRATVLRALLLHAPQEAGEIAALKLAGAKITGALDLRYATVDHITRLSTCHFDEVPDLSGARLRHLNLGGSALPGLRSAHVRIEGALRLTGCRFGGPLQLTGAQITGQLFLDRAQLTSPDEQKPVLRLDQAVLGDDVSAAGLRAHGQVRLDRASVVGTIDLDDAFLSDPRGTALTAQTLTVGADLRAMRLVAHGLVDLRGARIPGQLNLAHAQLSHPGGRALRASSAVIGELWLREAEPVVGSVNLRRAQVDLLHIAPETWPDRVQLDGLTYTTLAPHQPAERRLPAVLRDTDGYVPHAYEQLAAAYRRIGDDHAARLVQLARQRRHRATLPSYARLWGYVQDGTVGYGFRPLRAAVWLLSLLAIGSAVYALHPPRALKPSEAPHFNPVFYTLDLLLPVISFGQEDAFAPDGWYQGLSYALIITGWILATTVVTGVTRTVSRQ